MRVLVVHAHPVAESFSTLLFRTALDSLRQAGHEVRGLDLYACGFEPVMRREERLDYHTAGANAGPVADHLAQLKWAQGLIFVYPTWWYSHPAMLKGWLDRVWVPHETFTLPEGNGPIRGLMTQIRLLGGISTYGAPWLWTRWVGDPGRRVIMRGLRAVCAPRCKTFWLALYRMDNITDVERRAFVERVRARLARIG
jgi:NAD(P)H dehydrogenase (quinone)